MWYHVGSDVADARKSLDVQFLAAAIAIFLKQFLALDLRSDSSFFELLKPEMALNLKLFLASKFNIFEDFRFQPTPALCEYLSQTFLSGCLNFSFQKKTQ